MKVINPSERDLSNLLKYYQNRKYDEAESLAVLITQQFPEHQFTWKVLGSLLGKKGMKSEALRANQKAVKLVPEDAEAHFNLGNTLLGLERLEEAEASYKKTIMLKPDFVSSYNNLGIILQKLGRLDEAEANYLQAIGFKPDYAEAHNNLGNTLKELGRLDEADRSYRKAIEIKPDYAEAHSSLGNTLQKLERFEDSEISYKQAIALKSNYAEAHYNLGITLNELGRLDEAEVNLRKAILLKPSYTNAYNNLGVTLKALHRLSEAEACYTQAIALKPNLTEAHYNLGITLKELGRLDEAEASLRQAILLKPNFPQAYNNLGNIFQDLGRLDEAAESYRQSIALKPDYIEAIMNLSIVMDYMNNLEEEIALLQDILQINTDNDGLRAGVNLAICNFLKGEFEDSRKHLLSVSKIQEKTSLKFKNEKVYHRYLLKILEWHQGKSLGASNLIINKNLYIIGDSHSLTFHGLNFQSSSNEFSCKAKLIKGCKQWDLGNSIRNKYKNKFESIFFSLPKSSEVLLSIGEIDCRLDSGIIKHNNKFPKKNIYEIIKITIENYLSYIFNNNISCQHNIIIQGVPCPNINKENSKKREITELGEVINIFNSELKNKTKEKGFSFFDIYKLTDRGDGFANSDWHIDNYHLSPEGVLEAWRRYCS